MECLHLFKAAKFNTLKMHVLCKVVKMIVFQNKTLRVYGSTDKIKHFGSEFVILNIF